MSKNNYFKEETIEVETRSPKKNKKERFKFAKELAAFTPKQMKAKYDAYGVKWRMRDFYITYFVAISAGFLFSFIFDLRALYAFITIFICTLIAPFFIMSQKKNEYEKSLFTDINIYMQQMCQSMVQKNRIITALKSVSDVFPRGEMKDTINKALAEIAMADNVREGEIKGFEIIEKKYKNKPLHTLHEFSMRLEDRGGDYSNELELLNKTRARWKERIENYQKDLTTTMIASCIEYAIVMGVCGFIQHTLPEQMSTAHLGFVQIAEVFTISLFALLILGLQKKRCKNWLQSDDNLSDEDTIEALEYLETYTPKEKRRLSIKLGAIWATASGILFILTKSIVFFVIAAIIGVALFNLHNIIHLAIKNKVKNAIKSAFPVWLFDICLLVQKENITVAITKSIPEAPLVMRKELEKLVDALRDDPNNPELFFNFLSEYKIPGIKDTMCMMVSLNSGIGGDKQMQMEALVKANTNMIDKEDQINAKTKEAALARYYYYPLLPCAALMACYFYAIIMRIIQNVVDVLAHAL